MFKLTHADIHGAEKEADKSLLAHADAEQVDKRVIITLLLKKSYKSGRPFKRRLLFSDRPS